MDAARLQFADLYAFKKNVSVSVNCLVPGGTLVALNVFVFCFVVVFPFLFSFFK